MLRDRRFYEMSAEMKAVEGANKQPYSHPLRSHRVEPFMLSCQCLFHGVWRFKIYQCQKVPSSAKWRAHDNFVTNFQHSQYISMFVIAVPQSLWISMSTHHVYPCHVYTILYIPLIHSIPLYTIYYKLYTIYQPYIYYPITLLSLISHCYTIATML